MICGIPYMTRITKLFIKKSSDIMKSNTILWIIAAIIVINLLIFWFMKFNGNSNLPIETLYERSDYNEIVWVETKKIEKEEDVVSARTQYVMSLLKLWLYDDALVYIKETPKLDEVGKELYKALTFYEKEDRVGLEKYLKVLKNSDPKVRSLFLQLRAVASISQWKIWNAKILSNDVSKLDPLAPAWLNMLWNMFVKEKKWEDALKNFERARTLWFSDNPETLYNQALTEFQLKRYDDMQANLELIYDDSIYWYKALILAWKYFQKLKTYDQARTYFNKAAQHSLASENNTHEISLANLWLLEEDYETFIEYAKWLLETWDLRFNWMVNLFRWYSETWKNMDAQLVQAQIEDSLGKEVDNFKIYVAALFDLWLFSEAENVLENWLWLFLEWSEKSWELKNLLARSFIHQLNAATSSEDIQYQLDRLINISGVISKDRFVYIWLTDFMYGDTTSGLRALQEIQSTATEDDLRIVEILHYIFSEDYREALNKLGNFSPIEEYDIDYQRLKWKILSSLQDWANTYEEEAISQLEKLNQSDDNPIRLNNIFERRFNKWLKHMKHFY